MKIGGILDRRPDLSVAYALISAIKEMPDAEAVHILSPASASTDDGSVLVFEQLVIYGAGGSAP